MYRKKINYLLKLINGFDIGPDLDLDFNFDIEIDLDFGINLEY